MSSLYIGAKVKVIDYPMTSKSQYPIGIEGQVITILSEGCFEVKLATSNPPFCDGVLLLLGRELDVLPITSPDAADTAKGDDGLAGTGVR